MFPIMFDPLAISGSEDPLATQASHSLSQYPSPSSTLENETGNNFSLGHSLIYPPLSCTLSK